MNADKDYVFVLLMRALELETGSVEATWQAVLKAHQYQLDTAPVDIAPLLTETFERLIANRFGNPTIH